MNKLTSKTRVAKNTFYLFIRLLSTVFLSLFSTRLILEALGSSDYGLYVLIASSIAMFGFLNGSLASASQRYMSFAMGKDNGYYLKSVFVNSFILHLILSLILVVFFYLIGPYLINHFFNITDDRLSTALDLFDFMLIGVFFTILRVPFTASLMANENMTFIAVVGFLESLLKLIVALLVAYKSSNQLLLYGFLMSFVTIIIFVVNLIYTTINYTEVNYRITKYFDNNLMKELVSFSGWSFLGISSTMISSYGQNIVLNSFFGTSVNAAHGVAEQLRGQLSSLSNVLMKALAPAMTKQQGSGNTEGMIDYTLMGCRISFYLLMVTAIPFYFEINYILSIWLENIPEYAIVFCKLIIIRALLEQFFIPFITSINATGHVKFFNLGLLILSIFPLPMAYYFFYAGSEPFIIYIVFIGYSFFWAIFIVYQVIKVTILDLNFFLKNALQPALKTFLLVIPLPILITNLFDESIYRLILIFLIYVLSSMLIIYKYGLLKNERNSIKIMLNTYKKKLFV